MKKINEIDLAMIVNNKTLFDYQQRLKLIAMSLFEWEGLEEIGGNSDFLENTLFNKGVACFVKDNELGYLTLECNDNGTFNVYNEPTTIVATGFNYNKKYDVDDVVIIKNNPLKIATFFTINLFAYRLYEVTRTMDVNLQAQKTPVVIEGDTKDILTLKNAYEQYTGNMPVLFGKKNFDITNKLNTMNTEAPFLLDKLYDYKNNLWSECLTYLGINNANTDKKERLISDEVNSNNELIEYYLNCFYLPRKKACDEINNKFFNGEEKIKVKVNKHIENLIKDNFNDIINVGDMNGEIYDYTSNPNQK